MFEEWRLKTQEKVSFRKHNSKRKRKLNKRNEIILSIKDHHEEEGPFHKTSKNDEKIPILCHYLITIFVLEFSKNLKNASARSTILI